MSETVRDAMVPEPTMLVADANAQEAGQCLDNEDVRAVFVVEEDGSLVGVLTRKTLVREVVAAGRNPLDVRLREIAEPPMFTLDAELRSPTRSRSSRSTTTSACLWSKGGSSSASSRGRSCSAASPRTSRRSSTRIPALWFSSSR